MFVFVRAGVCARVPRVCNARVLCLFVSRSVRADSSMCVYARVCECVSVCVCSCARVCMCALFVYG